MATAISSELTCPICLELFEDPVTLACMHSYCRHCLESIVKSVRGKRLRCPECRYEAALSNDDVQKLPRNFTLANIVAKCEKVENVPQIPCDLCDEKPPSIAVKSCKECKISYCGHCLFLHPKKGVLATHSLVEPRNFQSEITKEPPETFCMKCVLVLKYEDDKEYCQHDHPTEIMDIDAAKAKMVSHLQEAYVRLDDRKEKYTKDLHTTEDILNNLKKNTEQTRTIIEDEMKKKCEDATKRTEENFQEQKDEIQRHFQEEQTTIQNEFVVWTNEFEDKNDKYLRRLQEASTDVSDVLSKMQTIFQAHTNGEDMDLKDLISTYTSVHEAENNRGPGINLHKKFNLTERLEKVKAPCFTSEDKMQKTSTGRVEILKCTSNIMKKEDGASVTVTWFSTVQGARFELKFVEVTRNDTYSIFTISGIRNQMYTEKRLQHNTKYEVTVSVQDNPLSESERKQFCTLPGIPCEAFQFSSVVKSLGFDLQWDNKRAVYCENVMPPFMQNTGLRNVLGGALGTLVLRDTFQYWEVQISFHFRGVKKNDYVAAVGICAAGNIDAVESLAKNYFFYGLLLIRNYDGSPIISFTEAGKRTNLEKLKTERSYNKRIGFFYDPRELKLSIVEMGTLTDKIMHTTDKLKVVPGMGMKLEYYPVCDLNDIGDPVIEILTGSEINHIPSCIEQVLKK